MSGTVMANKNGVTYFFTENAAGTYEFWTIKVNGTVVEYVAKDGVSKLSNKDLYDKYNGNGTGFIWKSGIPTPSLMLRIRTTLPLCSCPRLTRTPLWCMRPVMLR